MLRFPVDSDRSVPDGELRFVRQCIEHLGKLKDFESVSFDHVFTMNQLFETSRNTNLEFSLDCVLIQERRVPTINYNPIALNNVNSRPDFQ